MKNFIKKFDKKSIYLIIMSFLVLGIMTSFALSSFLVTLLGANVNRINTCSLSVNMLENVPISLLNTYPIDDEKAAKYEPFEVTLTNNSNCNTIHYRLDIVSSCDSCSLTNGMCAIGENTCNCNESYQIDPELIKYEIKNTTTGEVTSGSNPYNANIEDTFTSNTASITYEIKMWITSTATNKDLYVYNGNLIVTEGTGYATKNFCSRIKVDVSDRAIKYTLKDTILENNTAYLDSTTSPYVTGTGIDFSTVSSPTNGQGLYYTTTGTEDSKPSYYFRGGSYCSNASITTSSACTTAGGAWSTNHCTLSPTTKTTCEATTGNVWYELNNWVSFAGYYWQIVRINEDDSVRLIYAGTSIATKGSDDQIGTSAFNEIKVINGSTYVTLGDVTSVGYMFSSPVGKTHTDNIWTKTYTTGTSSWTSSASRILPIGNGYYFDTTTGMYKLCSESGVITSSSACTPSTTTGTYGDGVNKYICYKNGSSSTCKVMLNYTGTYSSGTTYYVSGTVNVHSSSYTTSAPEAIGVNANEIDSNMKVTLEDWYERKIKGITTGTCSSSSYTTRKTCLDNGYTWTPGNVTGIDYSSYIADSGYCNDRSLYSGNGYGKSGNFKTYYGTNAYTNIVRRNSPQYACDQANDLFTVTNNKGNTKSIYPIGLITSDEATYLGGHYNNANYSYQLRTGNYYWALSPFYFYNYYSDEWLISSTGLMTTNGVLNAYGVRPVISLKSNIQITSGNGSSSNPYVIG